MVSKEEMGGRKKEITIFSQGRGTRSVVLQENMVITKLRKLTDGAIHTR
jgi:hypothetical protein